MPHLGSSLANHFGTGAEPVLPHDVWASDQYARYVFISAANGICIRKAPKRQKILACMTPDDVGSLLSRLHLSSPLGSPLGSSLAALKGEAIREWIVATHAAGLPVAIPLRIAAGFAASGPLYGSSIAASTAASTAASMAGA